MNTTQDLQRNEHAKRWLTARHFPHSRAVQKSAIRVERVIEVWD